MMLTVASDRTAYSDSGELFIRRFFLVSDSDGTRKTVWDDRWVNASSASWFLTLGQSDDPQIAKDFAEREP